MNKVKYITAVLIALAGLGLQQAKADFVSFIDSGNSDISGFPGPYAKVVVSLTSSTTATVTFTSLTASGNIYLMGDGGSADVNVNASSFTITNISGSNGGTGFTQVVPVGQSQFSIGGTGNVDDQGSFNAQIDSFDGFTHSSDTITFTLTNIGGTWASAADVLIANADGIDAAMHVFVTSSPANGANGAIKTGFAGETGRIVPDGGTTAMLLGLGLSGLGLVRRFVKR
jgi:hypothetical protein